MKRFFLFGLSLVTSLAVTTSAVAATEWYLQYTIATKPFYDSHAIDDNTAVAVGASGYIAYTADGGDAWSTATSGTANHLFAVDAASDLIWYAAGFNGTVTRSINGGSTWATLASGTSADLWGVAFVDKKTGIVAGESGTVLQTTDGATFTARATGTTNDLLGATAADASTIYAVGEAGTIAKSTNKGMGWSLLTSGVTEPLHDVWCSSATRCIAVGESGTVIETTDGTTWQAQGVNVGGGTTTSIDGYDADHFSIGVSNQQIYTTANGGSTFTTTNMAEGTPYLNAITYPTSTTRYVAGSSPESNGVIWKYDGTAPSVPGNFAVTGGTPTADTTPTFTWNAATDNVGVTNYVLDINDGDYVGVTTSTSFTFASAFADGDYEAVLTASDAAGNESSTELTLTVDTTDPTVGSVSPIAAFTAEVTTFTVIATDAGSGIASCDLAINGLTVGAMSHASGNTYTRNYTFTVPGAYSVFAACLDEADNATAGAVTTMTVAVGTGTPTPDPEPDPIDEAAQSTLIKTACAAGAGVNDPCKAVYWYGTDGMRHPFPNEKAYFTWFADFDDVITVSQDFMSSIQLGQNVTYKPGSKMVKFPSVNTVYVVGTNGELRAIASEAVAADLYGSDWNTKIDDINVAFYFNYDYGADVNAASDYNIAAAQASMSSPNELFD